jgi:prepilin peptidase CpaA
MVVRGTDYAWATLGLTAVCAIFDWRVGRIPNVLTLGVIPLAAGMHYFTAAQGRAWEAAGFSFLGAMLCAFGPAIMWRAGWVGGGDVKLLAAMGAVSGPSLGVEAAFFAFFCAMAFVIVRLSWRGTLFRTIGNSFALAASPLVSKARRAVGREETLSTMRFGPFAFAGAAITIVFHGGIL